MFMRTFEWLPLAATIDGNIFCCHAGLPRAVMMHGEELTVRLGQMALQAMDFTLNIF